MGTEPSQQTITRRLRAKRKVKLKQYASFNLGEEESEQDVIDAVQSTMDHILDNLEIVDSPEIDFVNETTMDEYDNISNLSNEEKKEKFILLNRTLEAQFMMEAWDAA